MGSIAAVTLRIASDRSGSISDVAEADSQARHPNPGHLVVSRFAMRPRQYEDRFSAPVVGLLGTSQQLLRLLARFLVLQAQQVDRRHHTERLGKIIHDDQDVNLAIVRTGYAW